MYRKNRSMCNHIKLAMSVIGAAWFITAAACQSGGRDVLLPEACKSAVVVDKHLSDDVEHEFGARCPHDDIFNCLIQAVEPKTQVPKSIVSEKYLKLRKRFLRNFDFNGEIAAWKTTQGVTFSDQTMYMGFALIAFSGEARVFHQSGGDVRPAEVIVQQILKSIDKLDGEAQQKRYKTQLPGFMMRDYVHDKQLKGVKVTGSDYMGAPGDADMSLDQVVMLTSGLWAVTHFSTDELNRKHARQLVSRLANYWLDERFMFDVPGTKSLVHRGGDARAAAGFLCRIAGDATGHDYYHEAKVRLLHDNRCHTCAGTGQVNAEANLQCPACSGSGDLKIVLGGGRCEVCRGTGDVRLVVESDCPACSGQGEIRLVVTDFFGHDHTIGRRKCDLCSGHGKIGGKTKAGKCKVCNGKGRFPSYVHDFGKCKMCAGSGRIKGKLPKINCPMCGGSKELNVYVRYTQPVVLGLEPLTLARISYPEFRQIPRPPFFEMKFKEVLQKSYQSYVRHLNLTLMALDHEVPDLALLACARDSRHPWSALLRAASETQICQGCDGTGQVIMQNPLRIPLHIFALHAKKQSLHKLGKCALCDGKGVPSSKSRFITPLLAEIVALYKSCPDAGPSSKSPSLDWAVDNRWVRCTDLNRSPEAIDYNGLDFMSFEILIRLAGYGDMLH